MGITTAQRALHARGDWGEPPALCAGEAVLRTWTFSPRWPRLLLQKMEPGACGCCRRKDGCVGARRGGVGSVATQMRRTPRPPRGSASHPTCPRAQGASVGLGALAHGPPEPCGARVVFSSSTASVGTGRGC
mmetsp:Transcript_23816/g.74081  ORF Transcript_23816/g.74081 Transcript_23816/m.74081 type:complete len:132 (-) Transcript_23816:112-507(-)